MRQLTYQELSTILAALRLGQQERDLLEQMDHFADVEPLSDEEIDELCEDLNCGEIVEVEDPQGDRFDEADKGA